MRNIVSISLSDKERIRLDAYAKALELSRSRAVVWLLDRETGNGEHVEGPPSTDRLQCAVDDLTGICSHILAVVKRLKT